MKSVAKVLKIFTFADIFLIIGLLLLAGFLSVKFSRNLMNQKAYIYQDNQLIAEYSLADDRTVKLNEHATIQIKDGRIRMLKSDCKNQLCVKQKWSSNLPIICVPNKITIVIKGKDKNKMIITS